MIPANFSAQRGTHHPTHPPHPHRVCFCPNSASATGPGAPYPHPYSPHYACTIVSHSHLTTTTCARDTLPDKQCVPRVFAHQHFSIATGDSSLAVRKNTWFPCWRNIPYHFTPHHRTSARPPLTLSTSACPYRPKGHTHIVGTRRCFQVMNAWRL